MLKFHNRNEPQTVDEYTGALEKRLRRRLPRQKADEVTQEAHAHLSDRVEELTDKGVAGHEAETVAIAGFGPVAQYARAAVLSAYSDRSCCRFQRAGRIAVIGLLSASLVVDLLPDDLRRMPGYPEFCGYVPSSLIAAIGIAALGSRLPQTRTYARYALIYVLISFVVAGLRYVPHADTPLLSPSESRGSVYQKGPGLPRDDYSRRIAALRNHWVYREIALLKQGVAVYQADAPVPASLRFQGGYIVPNQSGWVWCSRDTDVLALQVYPHSMNVVNHKAEMMPMLPYRTVATRSEAVRLWAATGPQWLAGKQQVRQGAEQARALMEQTSRAPWGFNLAAARLDALRTVNFFWMLLVPDFLLAHLGRALWVQYRNVRRRGRTA